MVYKFLHFFFILSMWLLFYKFGLQKNIRRQCLECLVMQLSYKSSLCEKFNNSELENTNIQSTKSTHFVLFFFNYFNKQFGSCYTIYYAAILSQLGLYLEIYFFKCTKKYIYLVAFRGNLPIHVVLQLSLLLYAYN